MIMYKVRISSMLAISLLAVVFAQQTSMAQLVEFSEGVYRTVNSPGSILHGRNGAVANAIMSELGILPSLKKVRSGIPYGVTPQTINNNHYNQVTNLAQLSGITSLRIHGTMRPLDGRSWYNTYRYTIRYFRSFSSSDFIGLTNLHTLNLASVRVSTPKISYTSQLRRSNHGLSFNLDAFENLPNLRTLIIDGDRGISHGRLFSLKPLLDFQMSSLVRTGYWYHEEVFSPPDYPTGNVDSPGSFFHGRPRSVTRSILSALADANTDITHYNQVTNVAQLRDIEEMTLYISSDYGLDAVAELNSLISAEVFDNLVNLRTLNLRVGGLTSLPAGIFDNLVNLQSLDLSHNRLTSLPSRLFDNLVNLDPAVLRGLLAPIIQVSPATLDHDNHDNVYYHETTPNGFKITEGENVNYSISLINIPSNFGESSHRYSDYSVRAAVFDVSINPNLLSLPIPELRYSTQDGTAKAGEDYQPVSGRILASQYHVVGRHIRFRYRHKVIIPILNDYEPEPDETFTVVFEEDSDDPQYRWTFTVTIKDNDPDRVPNVNLDVAEHIVTVITRTSTNFGRLVKIPEDPRQVFERYPNDPAYGSLAGRVAVIRIDGIGPRLLFTSSGIRWNWFNSVSNIVSSGSVPIPVELSVPTGRTVVSVDYATQDGTAKAGEDYTETRGTLTFQPGQYRRYLSIPILDDAINETNEFFNVVLSNPTNSVLLPRTVKVQILDNDEPAPNPPPVNVYNGGAVTPIITPFPSQIRGSASSSIMFRPTSLSLSESGSATYQVRATALPAKDMTVNLETSHSGITLDPRSLLFTADNWQTYQTVTVSASSDAADTNEQASIQHSIPGREGFIANNNAGIVPVTLSHTVVEEEETPEPQPERHEVEQVQLPPTDYDQDDDGLIDISNLAQLNAIRWDLNGDGQPDKEEYTNSYNQAFPSAIDNMGIPADIQAQGYELGGDLDFGDNPTSWESIGVFSQSFQAVFEGNDHVIFNLFQDQSDPAVFANKPSGLFGSIGHRGQVANLGLEGVQINGNNFVGALAGFNLGSISICSAQGRVEGVNGVGGLVGQNFGDIVLSAADVEVKGVSGVGDLVGIDTQRQ